MFDVNGRLADMLGYRAEELIGMPVAVRRARGQGAGCGSGPRGSGGRLRAPRAAQGRLDLPGRGAGALLTLQGRQVRVAAVRDLSERRRLEGELRAARDAGG